MTEPLFINFNQYYDDEYYEFISKHLPIYKKDLDEYKYNIFEAMLNIRMVEKINILFMPCEMYEFSRYKPYPYKSSMFRDIMRNNGTEDEAYYNVINKRIKTYLDDFIWIEDVDRDDLL